MQDAAVKSLLTYAIKIAVGAGLLAATLWWASPKDLAVTLARVDASAALAVLVVGLQIALAGERWRLLVAAAGTSINVKTGLQIGFVGSLSGQILPGGAGVEIARIAMGRLSGMSWRRLVSLAVLDRVLVVFALAVTAAIGLYAVVPGLRPLLLTGLLCALLAGALGVWLIMTGRWTFLMRFRFFDALLRALHAETSRPLLFFWAAGLALLSPLNLALAAWILAGSMQIDLSLIDALTWIPLVWAATIVPVSFGGWGVREAAAVALLSQIGMPASEALALSISLGIAGLIAASPAAFMLPTDWRRALPGH